MNDYAIWFIASFVLLIAELMTGTFYILMLALGIFAGGLAAWLGLSLPWQFLVAALVGVLASLLLRRNQWGKANHGITAVPDASSSLDLGQTVEVKEWVNGMARVNYRGSEWDAVLAETEAAVTGSFLITEVRGNQLILSQRKTHHV